MDSYINPSTENRVGLPGKTVTKVSSQSHTALSSSMNIHKCESNSPAQRCQVSMSEGIGKQWPYVDSGISQQKEQIWKNPSFVSK